MSFPIIAILLLVPLASALASYYSARSILLVLFLLLGSTVFAVFLRPRSADRDQLFLTLVWTASLSLLLSAALASTNLSGYDIHQEFNVFLQVSKAGVWNSLSNHQYNSALSVTILPFVTSLVSGLDGLVILKFVYPLIYSTVPVILYKIYRRLLNPEAAFLSVFVFVFYASFYDELISIAKQEVAELLVALVLLLLLTTRITRKKAGRLLVLVMTAGVIISHYSLAYIYILVFGFSIFAPRISRRFVALGGLRTFLISVAVALSWYSFAAAGSAIVSLTYFTRSLAISVLRDFFDPSSRPTIVLQALGISSVTPGLLHDWNRVTHYLVLFTLLLGFFAIASKRGKTDAERKMLTVMTAAWVVLGAAVSLPLFASGLNLSRFYHITLLFVSPCMSYGAQQLVAGFRRLLSLLRPNLSAIHVPLSTARLYAAVILLSYFLFTSGWTWAVSLDRPTSLILDSERMLTYPDIALRASYFNQYTVSQDVVAARWMKSHLASQQIVCADQTSRYHVLTSYGDLPTNWPTLPSDCDLSAEYVYLSALNTLYGIGTTTDLFLRWPISDISMQLMAKNKLYSNGSSLIYG